MNKNFNYVIDRFLKININTKMNFTKELKINNQNKKTERLTRRAGDFLANILFGQRI